MDVKANAANFWTAALGLVAALFTLLAAIGGTAGFFQGGNTTAGGESPAPGSITATATATPSLTPRPSATPSPRTESAKATPTPSPTVWREGTVEIPVAGDNEGQMADFDTGELVRAEKAEEARDADLGVTEDGDEIVLEPGVGRVDGGTFYARFIMIGDEPAGRDGCAAAESGPTISSRLRLDTDVEVGSHVCLVTTQGHIAEFEIRAAKLTGRQRWLEIRYTTWAD